MKTITIFCSSKQNLDQVYKENITKVIKNLDKTKFILAYGGGTTGLMGIVRSEWEGKLISSNMTKFVEDGVSDTYIFDNIVDRQKKLVEIGDSYLIFPGGYGTHYEMMEVITKNDVKEASKPIFIFNVNGIFDNFIQQIKKLHEEKFISHSFEQLQVYVESDYNKLVELINSKIKI